MANKPIDAPGQRHTGIDGLFETERPKGLHERVYRSLFHAVMTGKYETCARLPTEDTLADVYSVSRPVLRQALDRLRAEGLVDSRRGSGNYVANAAKLARASQLPKVEALARMQQMMDDLEFRSVVEPQAAYLASQRRDQADLDQMHAALDGFKEAYQSNAITHHFDFLFHEALARATANPQFVNAIRALEYSHDDGRILVRNAIHFPQSAQGAVVLKEHLEILNLIERRDDEGARVAMSEHIGAAKRRLSLHMKSIGI